MIRSILFALLLVFAAGSAHAEACNTDGSGTWTAFATGTVSWTNCTPTDDDDYNILDGFTVTIPAGVTLTWANSGSIGIDVKTGGTLIMEPGSKILTAVSGLDCDTGSTCTLEGSYLEQGITSPGTSTSISATNIWKAGEITLCPSANCDLARLEYTIAVHEIQGGGPGETFIEAAIDNITPNTDVLCWYESDPTSDTASVDEGFCYEITQADTAGDPYFIEFQVTQTTRDQHGYLTVRKEILQTTLSAGLAKGDRLAVIQIGDFPADNYYDGRMIRFEDGAGNPENVSYRISVSEEEGSGADTITIADRNGFKADKASGDDVWIDYGWAAGDTFIVMHPVRIESSTSAEEDSDSKFAGTSSIEAVVFKGTGRVWFDLTSISTKFTHVWLQDATNSATDELKLASEAPWTGSYVTITGGSITQGNDVNHVIVLADASTAPVVMDMVALRYGGDDYVTVEGSTGTSHASMTFNRLRCQFSSDNAGSQGCLKGRSNGSRSDFIISAVNVEVLNGIRDGDLAVGAEVTGRNMVVIGSQGVVQGKGTGDTHSSKFDNIYYVGNNPASGSGEWLMPNNSNHFVVRDNIHSGTAGGFFRNTTGVGQADLNLRNGIVIDNTIDLMGLLDVSGLIENVAFIRNISVSGSAASVFWISLDAPSTDSIFRNILIVDGLDEYHRGVIWDGAFSDSTASVIFDGLAVVDVERASSHAIRDNSSGNLGYAGASNLCFFNNLLDSEDEPNLPSDSIRSIDPGFVDTASDNYMVRNGSVWDVQGCGLKAATPPGVCRMNRTLAWSNLAPECMSEPAIGGGRPSVFTSTPLTQ